jgi:hypothetical protein
LAEPLRVRRRHEHREAVDFTGCDPLEIPDPQQVMQRRLEA